MMFHDFIFPKFFTNSSNYMKSHFKININQKNGFQFIEFIKMNTDKVIEIKQENRNNGFDDVRKF